MIGEQKLDQRDFSREKVVIECNSQAEAVKIVQDFWYSMPHAVDLTLPPVEDLDGWCEELTAGDRTKIFQSRMPANRGKWLVSISGNHQLLTPEAEEWNRKRK
ncbi:MAG: hypothetical protein V1716_05425 [Candidatus Uhrbacteria bacterium]